MAEEYLYDAKFTLDLDISNFEDTPELKKEEPIVDKKEQLIEKSEVQNLQSKKLEEETAPKLDNNSGLIYYQKTVPVIGEVPIKKKKGNAKFNAFPFKQSKNQKSNTKVEKTVSRSLNNLKVVADPSETGPKNLNTFNQLNNTNMANANNKEPTGHTGRMTASSFMNVGQPSTSMFNPNLGQNKNMRPLPSMPTNYPKGIPRSFLTAKHQSQLESNPSQTYANNQQFTAQPVTNLEPIWEALPPKKPTFANTFNQGPTGQYVSPTTGQGVGSHNQFGLQVNPNDYEQPMFVQTESNENELKQQYSPSDSYADNTLSENNDEQTDLSPDSHQSGSKRLSAFQRLGPVTQPKKPKLTINLMVGKEQAVREVVKDSKEPEEEKFMRVIDRPDIQTSLDDTVMKYLMFWPWKRHMSVRKSVTARESKSVMQIELEHMEEHYDVDKDFIKITVTGYPLSWTKEDVLDSLLEALKGKSFIPCFIEFQKHECCFFVIRCKPALVAIHKQLYFKVERDGVTLTITISLLNLSVNHIDFIPRLVLRKRLMTCMENESEINLKAFTLGSDISHFLYFPLNRVFNQTDLMQLQSSVPWSTLTKLVLSHNRLTTLAGFNLTTNTPKLKHLDISHNLIDNITALLIVRELPLNCIVLEGNPLCLNYIDHDRYIKVLRMIFPALKEIDGVKIIRPGEFPVYKRNYSPPEAMGVVNTVLEIMFPLLDADTEDRRLIEDLYMDDAVLTITYMHRLRHNPIFKDYWSLFAHARVLDEGEMDQVTGATEIAKLISRWPKVEHDPMSFTVDVMYHTDTTTILRVCGIMKVPTDTLADEEPLLYFTRTLVLYSLDGLEYKITNEMLYWDWPDKEIVKDAFRLTTGRSKNLSLKLDSPPDAELKEKLTKLFMEITELKRKPSEKCLESKDWHFRNALEYFTKLFKSGDLESLYD